MSGAREVVTDVDLVLHDVDAGHLPDTEVLLESPDGRYAHVLSDAGGGAVSDLDLTLDDEAGADIPEAETPSTGGYRPRNYDGGDAAEPFGDVEAIAMNANLSVFDGGPVTGTWKLWVFLERVPGTSRSAAGRPDHHRRPTAGPDCRGERHNRAGAVGGAAASGPAHRCAVPASR